MWRAKCDSKGLQKRDYERKVLSQDYLLLVSGRFPQRLGRGEVCSMPNHSLWSQRHFTAMSVAIAIYCHSYKDSCKSRRWQFSAHQFVEVIFRRQPIHIRPHLASATSACCLWNWVSNAFTRGHVQSLHVISVFHLPSWFYDNLSGALLAQWDFIGAWAPRRIRQTLRQCHDLHLGKHKEVLSVHQAFATVSLGVKTRLEGSGWETWEWSLPFWFALDCI